MFGVRSADASALHLQVLLEVVSELLLFFVENGLDLGQHLDVAVDAIHDLLLQCAEVSKSEGLCSVDKVK